MGRFRSWNSGQFDPEAAACAPLRIHANAATHSFDAFLHDGQADARSGILLGPMQSFEHAKDALLMFRFDADAVVLDVHMYFVANALGPDADTRRNTGRN